VILQHAPGRQYFEGYAERQCRIPPVAEEIALIRLLGARTLAVTLNGERMTPGELQAERSRLQDELDIPVVMPLVEGVDALAPVLEEYVSGCVTA
jgi:uncharacterized NAD-dependent epimerase/dehydratase family protein